MNSLLVSLVVLATLSSSALAQGTAPFECHNTDLITESNRNFRTLGSTAPTRRGGNNACISFNVENLNVRDSRGDLSATGTIAGGLNLLPSNLLADGRTICANPNLQTLVRNELIADLRARGLTVVDNARINIPSISGFRCCTTALCNSNGPLNINAIGIVREGRRMLSA